MNRSRFFGISLISFFVSAFLAQNIFAQDKSPNVFRMHYYQKGGAHKKTGGAVSEKKKRIKGGEKFDEPNMFAQFQNEIRTRAGKSAPEYPANYLMEELTKSKARSRLSKSADLNWFERGPGNVSGRTRGIIVDQSDATHRTWFAGSVGGGIWRTTDAGATWINKTGSLPNLATTVLVQAQSDPDIIYCGTGEGFNNIDAVNGAGIFKSIDHGESWTQLASTANFDFRNINRIIVHPTNPSIVLACTNQSTVQRSTDGGTTWAVPPGIFSDKVTSGRIQDLKADPLDFSIQYCSVNNEGIFKSTDGGINWFKTGDGLTTSGRIEIAISSKNPNYIYASAQTTSGSALYLSEDKGGSWLQVNSSNGVTQNWLGSQGWYDNTIAVHPFNEKIVFFGGIDIWKAVISPDGGTSTTRNADFLHVTDGYGQYSKPYVHVDHHNLIMVPISSTSGTFWIVNGNDGGVSYSPDGGLHWFGNSVNNTAGNGGYNTTQFYGADKKPGFNEYIGGMQDNGTWQSPSGLNADSNSI
ncbi:MAG: hypothetical protein WC061_01795, partial [Melioribacteraceae bacterium]